MKSLIIIGAGGHGKVAADIALHMGYKNICIFDDHSSNPFALGFPVVGPISKAFSFSDSDFFVAIGNSKTREAITKQLEDKGLNIVSLVHPDAVIASEVSIGSGSVVMAGAVINPSVKIGKSVIINTGASVDHDNFIGDYSHVSVGTHLAGTVSVGKHCWLGIGTIVNNNVCICDDCYLGAGSLVVKDIKEPGLYYGSPVSLYEEFR